LDPQAHLALRSTTQLSQSQIELGINSRFCRWIFGCNGTSLSIGPFASMTKVQTGAGVPARELPPFARGTHDFQRRSHRRLGKHFVLSLSEAAYQKQASCIDRFW